MQQQLLSVTTSDGRTLTVREGGDPDGVPMLVHAGTPGSSLLYPPHAQAAEEAGVRLLRTLLGPSDLAVLDEDFAAFMLESSRAGIVPSPDGWFDDDLVLVRPWGFDLASIVVPVSYWHGEQDKFVPFSHGVWLAARIPGVEARLTPDDGHLTILVKRYGEIQGWLLDRFDD